MKKQTREKDFSQTEREYIHERDGGCIFCQKRYHMEDVQFPNTGLQIMHLIPRSAGGKGIRQNAALGCIEHHQMLDNGSNGRRAEMMQIFRKYLDMYYPGVQDSERIYSKWACLDGTSLRENR